jgi:hypothetical protein
LDETQEVKSLLDVASKVFPVIELSSQQAQDIIHGKRITLSHQETLAASFAGELLAILEPVGQSYRSVTVFPEAFSG